jgi:sporulation integral membrane protein YlbJ
MPAAQHFLQALKKGMVINMKATNNLSLKMNIQNRKERTALNKFIKGFLVLFLVIMILFPAASYEGATTGLLLWFHNVLPNLLPFIILSNLMIQLNIAGKISRLFHPLLGRLFKVTKEGCYPIIIGCLSGIPMGAKATADLVSEGKIEEHEGNFLITMCNNASPMFIIGYIAISQLKLPRIKYPLFVILYSSAVISALLCRFILHGHPGKEVKNEANASHAVSKPLPGTSNRFSFEILDNSIMNGFEVVTKIGGYIILFSIIAQIIHEIGPNISFYKAFLMGIMEITTGISQICKAGIDTNTKIVLAAVLTSFGGLSGMAQTKSVLGSTRLSMSYYVIGKLTNALVTFILITLYVTLFPF